MATKQTDTVAMTEEQLDGVSGGPHIRNYGVTAPNNVIQFDGVQGGVQRIDKSSPKLRLSRGSKGYFKIVEPQF